MLILTIRTDKPEAEIGLYTNHDKLIYKKWLAHRELGTNIHLQIAKVLQSQNKGWTDIEGIVFYKGPGSFTGLRIGAAVANSLAASRAIGIVGESGPKWLAQGLSRLMNGEDEKNVGLFYGAEAHVTSPRG